LLELIPESVGHGSSETEEVMLHEPEGASGVLLTFFPDVENDEIWLGVESLAWYRPSSLDFFFDDKDEASPVDDEYPEGTSAFALDPQTRPIFSIARFPKSIAAGAIFPVMLTAVCLKFGGLRPGVG